MTGRNNAAMARVKWPCVGPLASHIDGFAGHLAGEGYAPSTIHEKYGFLADLSSWLEARQIALHTLDEGQLTNSTQPVAVVAERGAAMRPLPCNCSDTYGTSAVFRRYGRRSTGPLWVTSRETMRDS